MQALDTQQVVCPYCAELIEIVVDASIPEQDYIEDCEVCCRPIRFHITPDQRGNAVVTAYHENE